MIFSRSWKPVFIFSILLSLMLVQQRRSTNYDCEICADKAGYYFYLPALFYYGFETSNYPEGIDKTHGEGFVLFEDAEYVITKFTSGVALLQLPFYTIGFAINEIFGLNAGPFSYFFLFFINCGAAVYLTIAFWALWKWYRKYVKEKYASLTVLCIFLGTNLFYYAIDETLMSHTYSFVVLSVLLYVSNLFFNNNKLIHYLLLVFLFAIAILLRPTNILFVPIVFLLDIKTYRELFSRGLQFLNLKRVFWGLLVATIVFLPQMIYWYYAFGKMLVWSYIGEGFSNWNSPTLLTTWFAPNGGLFTYTPLFILPLLYLSYCLLKGEKNAFLVLILFLGMSYLCASWWFPTWGCSFGKRPFIEYFPVLFLPLALLLQKISYKSTWLKLSLYFTVFFFIMANLSLSVSYMGCYDGAVWEWEPYFRMLLPFY